MKSPDDALIEQAEDSGVGAEIEPENEWGEPLDAEQVAIDRADAEEWKWRDKEFDR